MDGPAISQINIINPPPDLQNRALYLPTTYIQYGLMARSDWRLMLLLLSSHSPIVL